MTEHIYAPAQPVPTSVRGGVLVCGACSLLMLLLALVSAAPGDGLSFVVFVPLVLLLSLLFLACCAWAVYLLSRVRRFGLKFVGPFAICGLTLVVLLYAPFTQIWLQANFWWHRADRERIVEKVISGELTPNVPHNSNLIALGDAEPQVSDGNDIVVDTHPQGTYVLFLTSRGMRHHFSGFLKVPPECDPAQFFEFDDAPPKQRIPYGGDWYFVAN